MQIIHEMGLAAYGIGVIGGIVGLLAWLASGERSAAILTGSALAIGVIGMAIVQLV